MFNNPYAPLPITNSIGDMVWINSKDELNTVSVAPNRQKVFFLRDADNPIFYALSSNDMGMVSIHTYRFEEMVEPKPEEKYVTKEEFNKLLELLGGMNNESIIQTKQTSTT